MEYFQVFPETSQYERDENKKNRLRLSEWLVTYQRFRAEHATPHALSSVVTITNKSRAWGLKAAWVTLELLISLSLSAILLVRLLFVAGVN